MEGRLGDRKEQFKMTIFSRSPYQIGHMTTSVPAYIPAFSALVNALNFNMVGIYKGIDYDGRKIQIW